MLRSLAHVIIREDDPDAAVAWYRDVVGLVELDARDGIRYLGCGGDATADVGLTTGGSGLVSFAFTVGTEHDLDALSSRIDTRPLDRTYPGIATGVAFDLPSGHVVEAVLAAERVQYLHPTEWVRPAATGPLDADHINLHAEDVEATARFLVDTLDFRISDVLRMDGVWFAAWCRTGEWHHDIAIAQSSSGSTLHHFSFLTDGIAHHAQFADRLARHGHPIEFGLGRHGPGSNYFLYTRDPSGNRVEFTAGMSRMLDRDAPTRFWDDPAAVLNRWGIMPPPEFLEGT